MFRKGQRQGIMTYSDFTLCHSPYRQRVNWVSPLVYLITFWSFIRATMVFSQTCAVWLSLHLNLNLSSSISFLNSLVTVLKVNTSPSQVRPAVPPKTAISVELSGTNPTRSRGGERTSDDTKITCQRGGSYEEIEAAGLCRT